MRSTISSVGCVLSSVFVLAAFVACGGSTASEGAGTGSASGAVSGTSFSVASAFAAYEAGESSASCSSGLDGGVSCTSSSSGQSVIVALTNKASASCSTLIADIASKEEPTIASLDAIALIVANQTANLTPGSYPIVTTGDPNSGSLAVFQATTATCSVGTSQQATTGSVTLTKVSASEVAGSYSVTFGSEGTLSGTFDVDVCALPEGGLSDMVSTTGCTQ